MGHGARGSAGPRELIKFVVAALVGGLVSGMFMLMMQRPPTPEIVERRGAATMVDDPVVLMLAHIADDEFNQAEALWYKERTAHLSDEHHQWFSDDELVMIARAGLQRAESLKRSDPTQAGAAAELTRLIAAFLVTEGRDRKAKRAGSQLQQDIENIFRRPPAPGDAIGD